MWILTFWPWCWTMAETNVCLGPVGPVCPPQLYVRVFKICNCTTSTTDKFADPLHPVPISFSSVKRFAPSHLIIDSLDAKNTTLWYIYMMFMFMYRNRQHTDYIYKIARNTGQFIWLTNLNVSFLFLAKNLLVSCAPSDVVWRLNKSQNLYKTAN